MEDSLISPSIPVLSFDHANKKIFNKLMIKADYNIPDVIIKELAHLYENPNDATEVAFSVLGNVDAGKSSLSACLTERILDNGNGSSRLRILRHEHERISGRSSTITSTSLEFTNNHLLAFIEGRIHDEIDVKKNIKKYQDDGDKIIKSISGRDLCGHARYYRTTVHGVAGSYPDFGIVAINPARGVCPETIEHITLLTIHNIPIIIVITKIDQSIKHIYEETEKQIAKCLKNYKKREKFLNRITDYQKFKDGQVIFMQIRTKFYDTTIIDQIISKDLDDSLPTDVDEQVKKRNKIQTLYHYNDEFMIQLRKDHISLTMIEFKQKYELTDLGYDNLVDYINYNANRMVYIEQIVSNINELSIPLKTTIDSDIKDKDEEKENQHTKQLIVPVIGMSNVDGYNLDTLRDAIMMIRARDVWNNDKNAIVKMLTKKRVTSELSVPHSLPDDIVDTEETSALFLIERKFFPVGVGLVVSGINRGSVITKKDKLWIGPINKMFVEVKVKSIHNDASQFMDNLDHHHRGSLNITAPVIGKEVMTNLIREGSVLLSNPAMVKRIAFHFKAKVHILKANQLTSTFRMGSCPHIDIGNIRQSVRIVAIHDPLSSSADQSKKIVKDESGKQPSEISTESISSVSKKTPTEDMTEENKDIKDDKDDKDDKNPSDAVDKDDDKDDKDDKEDRRSKRISRKHRKIMGDVDNISISPGETKEVTFKFCMRPEFLTIGDSFDLRFGVIYGVGVVTSILPIKEDPDGHPDPIKIKKRYVNSGANVLKTKKRHTRPSDM